MARKHYSSKKRWGGSVKQAAPAEPQAPVRSEKMQAMMAEAKRREQEAQNRRDTGFVPKPRAVRRFEKYANMGD